MKVQLIYGHGDIRVREWDFVPDVGDVIWDESVEVTATLYKVTERNITLHAGQVNKVTLILGKL